MIVLPHLPLAELCLIAHRIVQLTAHHVLQHQSDGFFIFIDIVYVDDAGVVQPDQHVDLIFGLQSFVVVHLNRKFFPILSLYRSSHCA